MGTTCKICGVSPDPFPRGCCQDCWDRYLRETDESERYKCKACGKLVTSSSNPFPCAKSNGAFCTYLPNGFYAKKEN